MNETDLILEGIDQANAFPPFSARECIQTLALLPTGNLRRTINGELVRVGGPTHQKFSSVISCQDQVPPAFGKFWIGTTLKVGCIQTLTQSILPEIRSLILEREPLSLRLYDRAGGDLHHFKTEGKTLVLPENFPGGFVSYRPWLIMLVKSYHLETNEWGATVGWRLELEER